VALVAGVTLSDVRKSYGGLEVIHGIDLDIRSGEFMVLVGPSGCGKSTLLRMIAGLEEITDGTIAIGDRIVNDVPASQRNLSMVFQSYALYPHMSVRKNLAFGLTNLRMPRPEIERRVAEAAKILQIGNLMDRKPRQLSGGQKQRVAIGRAIVREPQLFLFDEPLSNLDAELRVQMRVELASLYNRLGTTMIYVTHDQVEAMTMATRIVVLAQRPAVVVYRAELTRAADRAAARADLAPEAADPHLREWLSTALAALDKQDHALLALRFARDATLDGVGHAVGTSGDAAHGRLRRLLSRLRRSADPP